MTRAWKAALGVLALILVAAATVGVLNWRAERAAAVAAANAEVQAAIAEIYLAMEEAATEGGDAVAALHLNLQEHLTVTERTDEELSEDRERQQTVLVDSGRTLQELAEVPYPDVPELADERTIAAEFDQLDEMKARAEALGQRLVTVAATADSWADALRNLRAQADRYVETVENQPETSDPGRLRELWEEEREVLEEYGEAAGAAAEVPGLRALAEAYVAYVEANLAFAEEAVSLLEDNEIEAYNERLRETYGEEDPFGFQTSVAEATAESFDVGVLAELAEVRDEAANFAIRVGGLRRHLTPSPFPR